jgi:hypothetical protein
MSPVLATTRRPSQIAVRVLRALRNTHEDMAFLWQRSLTLPQAPPRASTPTDHAHPPTTAQPTDHIHPPTNAQPHAW